MKNKETVFVWDVWEWMHTCCDFLTNKSAQKMLKITAIQARLLRTQVQVIINPLIERWWKFENGKSNLGLKRAKKNKEMEYLKGMVQEPNKSKIFIFSSLYVRLWL